MKKILWSNACRVNRQNMWKRALLSKANPAVDLQSQILSNIYKTLWNSFLAIYKTQDHIQDYSKLFQHKCWHFWPHIFHPDSSPENVLNSWEYSCTWICLSGTSTKFSAHTAEYYKTKSQHPPKANTRKIVVSVNKGGHSLRSYGATLSIDH